MWWRPGIPWGSWTKTATSCREEKRARSPSRSSRRGRWACSRGYWENPEANARSFRGDWYYTGDRASRDEDGYFWFVGRADDVIISASYRIGPFEVESAVAEHPCVAETAVVASPHEVRGQIVKAYVVLAEGFEPSDDLVTEIQDHVKSVTAPYKYPREIEFVTGLPKTISGKIRRTELRDRELARKQGAR